MTTHVSHHDVVVVGARSAGAATAMLLARAGHDVVMVDRSRPSIDTNSTHSLSRGGVVQLARWGLLDEVLASGSPPIRSVTFYKEGEQVRRTIKDRAGVDFLLAPRRYVLDDIIARAAIDAGATLIAGETVTGLLRGDDGRVTGVSARSPEGETRELRARLVVGADGVYSSMARWVEAETLESHEPSGAVFYTYVAGVPWDGFEFHIGDRAFAGVFPTHGDEACVWLIRPADDLTGLVRAGASKLDRWHSALADSFPDLAARISDGRVTATLRGSVGLPNHVRAASGPGWALVGDSGYHRDPITGHGMTDAFRDAEFLAEAAREVLTGRVPESIAMRRYENRRSAAIEEIFALTRQLGAFPTPDEFMDLQVRLSKALDVEARALAALPAAIGSRDERFAVAVA